MLTLFLAYARRIGASFLLALFLSATVAAADSSLYSLESAIAELVFKASRSVVTVQAFRPLKSDIHNDVSDEAIEQQVFSGIIISDSGLILAPASATEGSAQLVVSFDGQEYAARRLGTDYLNGVTLLDVGRRLGQAVTLTDQSGCAGQMILAVGHSYGLRASPSLGFCAGTRPDGSLQFSAFIASGAIGGGLFDLSGDLVGFINDGMGRGELTEAGLAVAAQSIPELVKYIRVNGDRSAGYVGISTAEIEITPGIEVDMPYRLAASGDDRYRTIDRAVLITEVVPSSPAARSGLRRGDLIYSAGGRMMTSVVELMNLIRTGRPGTTYELGIIRRDRPVMVRLVVGDRRTFGYSDRDSLRNRRLVGAAEADSLRREIEQLKRSIRDIEALLLRAGP